MDFEYLREMSSQLTEELFGSSFAVMATINIQGVRVSDTVLSDSVDAVSDGRNEDTYFYTYPLDLQKSYRIKVYPTETFGLRLESAKQFEYRAVGISEKWDLWISCKYQDVKFRVDNTLFDFAKDVQIYSESYIIKGVVIEKIGQQKVVHVFLSKNTDL